MRSLALLVLASPAFASPSYDNHKGVVLFSDHRCVEVLDAIDSDFAETPADFNEWPDDAADHFEELIGHGARQAMAWGFVLGFDTAKGGLHSTSETTLERFRKACDENPTKTGLEILTGLD